MKKKSSYQKMKDKYEKRIAELTDDIITLVKDDDFVKTVSVKMKWDIMMSLSSALFMGNTQSTFRQ